MYDIRGKGKWYPSCFYTFPSFWSLEVGFFKYCYESKGIDCYRYIMRFWSFFINLPADGSITNIRQRIDDLCMHRENMICFVSNIWFCGVYSNAIKLLTISLIRKHHQNYSKNMRSNFFRNEKICRTIFWIYTVCIYVLYIYNILYIYMIFIRIP